MKDCAYTELNISRLIIYYRKLLTIFGLRSSLSWPALWSLDFDHGFAFALSPTFTDRDDERLPERKNLPGVRAGKDQEFRLHPEV